MQDLPRGRRGLEKHRTVPTKKAAKAKVGPPLNGVVGRPAGSWQGFTYSEAMTKKAAEIGAWDEAKILVYLQDPTKYLGGQSKMVFKLAPEPDRKNVIAYLAQFGMDGKKK